MLADTIGYCRHESAVVWSAVAGVDVASASDWAARRARFYVKGRLLFASFGLGVGVSRGSTIGSFPGGWYR